MASGDRMNDEYGANSEMKIGRGNLCIDYKPHMT
jgi:hypothetical protein